MKFLKSFALLSGLSLVSSVVADYSNSTNSSSTLPPTSSSSSTTTTGPPALTATPYLTAEDNEGSPLWYLHVPGELGPWVELSFSSTGGANYNFDYDAFTFSDTEGLEITSDGNSFSVSFTGPAPLGEFLAGLFTARTNSDSVFGITVYVTVDTGNGDLRKRDLLQWTLTSYITISPSGSTSVSSSASGPFTYSSYTTTTVVIHDTETLTVTVPCESGKPKVPPTTGPITIYTTTETVIAGKTTTITVPCSTATGYPHTSGAPHTGSTHISTFEGGASSNFRFASQGSILGYCVAFLVSYCALVLM